MSDTTTIDPTSELRELAGGCLPEQALAFFDSLPPVRAEDLHGRWRGRALATGHPLDELLTAAGWYGKQFDGPEDVHPLLMETAQGTIFPIDPRRIPLRLVGVVPARAVATGRGLLPVLAPVLKARRPAARLRNIEHRGTVTAAMIYDDVPIIDVFRRVDATTILLMMDQRGADQACFASLEA